MKEKIYRLLSHITFGKTSNGFRTKYKLLKEKSIGNLLKKFQNSLEQTNREIQNVKNLYQETKCAIDNTSRKIEQQEIQKFEIYETSGKWFQDNFDEYLSQDLTDKYFAMIKDLDDKSKWIFDIILRRLLIAKQNNWGDTYFHATMEEKQELQSIQDELYNRIIPFKDNWYSYKGILMFSNNLEPGIWYYHHFVKEIENQKKIKSGNIIDAGGYTGDSALVLSDYTDNKIYSFEPHPKHFEIMKKVISKNKCNKIVPIMKALGNKEDKMYMPDEINMSNTLSSTPKGVEVEVTTLDKFVQENNLKISLLKIDIEGFERYLLEGAIETIKSQKPALLISIYHNGHDFFEIKPWLESLNLGYKFKIRKAWDHNTNRDTLLICEVR